MNQDKIKFLKEELERVDKWLSFAEAKNGALIAFNVAVISAVFSISSRVGILSAIIVIFSLISTGLALYSFIPKNSTDTNRTNLLFYKTISGFNNYQDYLDKINDAYLKEEYEGDLASEIYHNSVIAVTKYRLFKYATNIDITLLILICVLVVVA